MYIHYDCGHYTDAAGQSFEWDAEKAASNLGKHGVAFPEACEVFFDPFFHLVDATAGEESREAAIGYTENARLLFVVHLMRADHFRTARYSGREEIL